MKLLPPSRTLWAMPLIVMLISTTILSQSLKSGRETSMAASIASASGLGSLSWNPAGLTTLRDWEIDATYFYPVFATTSPVSLYEASIGKRFMDNHAVSLQISNGAISDFVVPSTFTIKDSSNAIVNSYDKTISYTERYSLGYAVRLNEDISVGFSARYLEESISDNKYSVDTSSVIHSTAVEYNGKGWNVDVGFQWQVLPDWSLGMVSKNLFHITESQLPFEAEQYRLGTTKTLEGGVAYSGIRSLLLGIDVGTSSVARLGGEWDALEHFQMRAGMYYKTDNGFSLEGIAVGFGGVYKFLHADLSYLTFINQDNRRGTVDITLFENSGIENIEYNPFTSDRVSLTLRANLGQTHESNAKIEYVEMLSDVFPASSNIHAFRPIGKARVRNVSAAPINAKVGFYVSSLMDAPTETKPYTIPPNQVLEIPFFAVFNKAVKAISSFIIQDGEVSVSASTLDEYDDRIQTRVLVHGKNDWNGDVMQLKYFVTPADPEIVKFTRATLSNHETEFDTVSLPLKKMRKARVLFNELVDKLVYVNDPKSSQDFVQYPAETLTLRGGDCDDFSVCLATVLASIGITPAFVDVIPPEQPQNAHVFLMFDTGIPAGSASVVSENPKRFVLRKGEGGQETVWIPVETTVIRKGFEEAWRVGAEEYFQDVEVNFGMAKGWVHVVDVEPVE